MHFTIVDIVLSQVEQSFSDEELSYSATIKVRDAVLLARNSRRVEKASSATIFVYRLPVMIDWSKYPTAFRAYMDELEDAKGTNPTNQQWVVWTEDFTSKAAKLDKLERPVLEVGTLLEAVRQQELQDFLSHEDVLFEHSGSAVFLLPSDQISDYFFRVGNLQSRHRFFSAVFFWTLDQLSEVTHILVDTWSISTTAAVCAEYLKTYRASQGLARTTNVTWSFAPSYLPKSTLRSQLVFEALGAASRWGGKVLFLTSFYSTGSVQRVLTEEVEKLGARENCRMVAIFATGKAFEDADKILCDVAKYIADRGLLGKTGNFPRDVPVLEVSKVSFFPDYRRVEYRPFLRKDTDAHRGFIEACVGKDIFSVHRDGRTSPHKHLGRSRHHAFHVDLPKLFETSYFRERVRKSMANASKPTCIMRDKSDGAKALEIALLQTMPHMFGGLPCVEVDDWRELSPKNLDIEIANDRSAAPLILVPAVITGQSIGDIKEKVRHLFRPDVVPRLHYVIGLLRPGDERTLKNYEEIGAGWVYPSHLTVCEKIVLPNWGRDECPWCNELNIIDHVKETKDIDEAVRSRLNERRARLQASASEGLIGSDVFFVPEPDTRLPFNKASLFLEVLRPEAEQEEELKSVNGLEAARLLIELVHGTPVTEADLCVCVANAIQNWRHRNSSSSLQRFTIDAATVSNDDKFNEARLRAAIWRALTRSERMLAVRHNKDFHLLISRIYTDADDATRRCLELEGFIAFGQDILRFHGDLESFDWSDFKYLCKPLPTA